MGRTVDSAAYLQAVIREWRVVKPDGVPLRAVYTLLQARERPRERPREGQDAPTRDLEALPEERAAAAGVLRKIIDKRKRGKQRAEPHPSEEDDREEGRAARPTEEAPKPSPPPVPLHEALGQALHMVLVGEPGAGKSVTLQYLGLVYACAAWVSLRADNPPEPCGQGAFTPPPLGLADEPLRIPFLIRLTDDALLTSLSDPKTRASALELHMLALWHEMGGDPALTLDDLRGWRDQGRLLVLLDGLDEVDAAQRPRVREAIRRFRLRAEACRIVVATRPAGYHPPLLDFQDFTLQPLNEATAPQFLRQWMAARAERPPDDPDLLRQAEAIWTHIQAQPGLRRLAATPLTLKMLAEVAAEDGLEAVRNRADLYQRAAEKAYWERARGRGVPSDKKAWVLALVEAWAWARHAWGWRTEEDMHKAWATMTWNPPGTDATEPLVPPGDAERLGQAEDWTRKYMLLEHGKEWAFWHQTWQEYFASRYLKRAWDRAAARAWPGLKPRLHHPAWQEVLYLLAAGMEDATPLVRRIRTARSPYERELLRDRALAARLVGDGARVAEDEVQRLLKDLQRPLGPRRARILQGALNRLKRWPLVTRSLRVWAWLTLPLRLGGLPITAWRVQAVRALAALGPRAIPVLERALKDADWHVRRAAAEALGAIEPAAADAVPALVRALGDVNRRVREAAAEALGAIGPAAVPALARALEDERSWVRRAAAEALGAIGPGAADAVPALARALEDERSWVHRAAAEALGAIGPAAVLALARALEDERSWVRRAAAEALGAIGPATVSALVRALGDASWRVRAAAAEALGAIGPAAAEAVPALMRALGDKDADVRRAAAEALGAMGPAAADAVPALVRALEDEDADVRRAAAEALGAIGPGAANAVPYLVRALGDEDADVRRAAARVLGAIGPAAAKAVPALIRALRDGDAGVRRAAAEALGALGPAAAEAVPALVWALRDGDWEVRRASAEALGAMGPAAADAALALVRALGDADWKVRAAAAEALGAIGPAAVPALVRALEDRDVGVRAAAARALEAIGPAAADAVPALVRALGDRHVRWAAARALRAIGSAAVPALARALEDTTQGRREASFTDDEGLEDFFEVFDEEEVEVRVSAAVALGAIGPAAAGVVVPALARALGNADEDMRRSAAEALGVIGPAAADAVPALVRALGDGDWHVRRAVARALETLGPAAAKAVPALARALEDEDLRVRAVAARALEAIGPAAADAVPALVRALGDGHVRWAAARALGAIGSAAVPALVRALGDRPLVREAAVRALGVIGSAAVPALVRALGDRPLVRKAAVRALGNIAEGLDDLALARKVARALWWRLTDWDADVREAAYEALGAVVARLTQLEVAQRVAKRKEPFPWSPPQEPQPMPRWRRAVWAVAAVVAFLLSSTLTAAINWLNSGIPTSPSAWREFLVKSLSFGSLGAVAVGLAALARKLWQKASEGSVEG